MIYHVKCKYCGLDTELSAKVEDRDFIPCPHCSEFMERVLEVPALVFKGSGFYCTDYAKRDRVAEKLGDDPQVVKAAEKYMESCNIKS